MRKPNLTPPRPVSKEPRPVGTRAVGSQLALPEPPSFRAVRNVALGIGAIVAAGFFVGAPYRTADRLAHALEDGDATKLEETIDFPALREDLKRQTQAALGAELVDDETGLAVVGGAFANAMIDATVRPELVAKLKDAPIDEYTKARMKYALKRARVGYEGPMSFSVRLVLVDISDDPVKLVLGRTGPFSWKVKSVTVPTDLSRLEELAKNAASSGNAAQPLEALVRVD